MSSPAHSPKNKAVAFMLAWFLLGQFGAHYFYLGNKRTGKIRLVLGLLVVPLPFLAVLAILEGLQYLRDSKERFAERVARGGGMANCWQKTAAVTIAGIALTVTALAFVPEPPPPDPAEAVAKDAEKVEREAQAKENRKAAQIPDPTAEANQFADVLMDEMEKTCPTYLKSYRTLELEGHSHEMIVISLSEFFSMMPSETNEVLLWCAEYAKAIANLQESSPIPATSSPALDEGTVMEACGALRDAIIVGERKGYSAQRIEMEIRDTMGWSHDQLVRALELCADFIDKEKRR